MRVVRGPLAAVALGWLAVLVIAAVLAPVLAPASPTATDLDQVLSGPTSGHPLGTDGLGRDVLSRLMYGGRVSLLDAAVAVLAVLLVGASSGLVAGYAGGWFDRAFMWVTDVLLAIPVIVTLLVILAVVGDNRLLMMTGLGVLISPGLARVVRGSTMAVRNERYVAAALVSGLPHRRIVLTHVLPLVSGPIIVQASLLGGGALLIDAGLSFLGFGAQPPTPTWGGMIAEASAVIERQPWLLIPPGAVLGLAILALGLLGDALRDASAQRLSTASRPVRRTTSPPPDTPTLLSMRAVSIAFPAQEITVVEHLDLEINTGETVGLVGESGCGKSITGRAVLGLLPAGAVPSNGSIWFAGTDLAACEPRALRRLRGSRIGLVSQDPFASLDPVFTVGAQVGELVRRHHGGPRSSVRSHTLDLLRDMNFPEPALVAGRYPHELSGGMAQRVAIAMALAGEPDLLIADEPTTALDAAVSTDVLDLLHRLQAERTMAILLISHDWELIAGRCHRAYVMYAGQVVESGDATELFDRPRHPYTAALLACAPGRARPFSPLAAIPGTVPPPGEWPSGCRFAPRCALATAECHAAPVAMVELGSDHHTRCVLAGSP